LNLDLFWEGEAEAFSPGKAEDRFGEGDLTSTLTLSSAPVLVSSGLDDMIKVFAVVRV
jgi:hypothetical protein